MDKLSFKIRVNAPSVVTRIFERKRHAGNFNIDQRKCRSAPLEWRPSEQRTPSRTFTAIRRHHCSSRPETGFSPVQAIRTRGRSGPSGGLCKDDRDIVVEICDFAHHEGIDVLAAEPRPRSGFIPVRNVPRAIYSTRWTSFKESQDPRVFASKRFYLLMMIAIIRKRLSSIYFKLSCGQTLARGDRMASRLRIRCIQF